MLLINVEKIFNQIWQIRQGRTFLQCFRDYFAMIVLGPLLLIASGAATVFITTRLMLLDGSLLSPFLLFLLRLMPYILVWILFTLLYTVIPNTRVHLLPALITGVVAGTAFQLIQWVYLTFQIGAAGLGLVYGSFATVPLLLIWMQISWTVVLFGAELTHAAQNIEFYRYGSAPKNISSYCFRLLSLSILSQLLKDYKESSFPLNGSQVSNYLKLPRPLIKRILDNLESVELLTVVRPEKGFGDLKYFKPAFDIDEITIVKALEHLELYGENEGIITYAPPVIAALEESFAEIQELIKGSDADKLLVEP